jgi:23S rRNA (uracil1939-C5)-methyltransferase
LGRRISTHEHDRQGHGRSVQIRRLTPPPAAEFHIERVGADGDGIATLADGAPLYLPGALPGEVVLARPTQARGEGWSGVVEAVPQPSAEREAAPCRHFGACGGCALQHWQDAGYRRWKTDLLRAALRRAGYESTPAPLAGTPRGSRRRMDLGLRRQDRAVVVGLHAPHGGSLVDLRACVVLHPTLFALLAPLRTLLRGLSALRREGAAVVNLLESGPDLLLRLEAPPNNADRAQLAAFAAAHGLPRIACAAGNAPAETACLLRPATTRLAGIVVAPPPGAFLQATAEGESAIIEAMLAGLPEKLVPKARIAELYAGCGTLSFALARRARVAAFEGDAGAAACLQAAANAAGLAGRIETTRRDLARQPLMAKELAPFAAVVLDPPHAGAAAQTAQIAASGVARVVYVSCNPAALARDAHMLRQAGYRLIATTPVDQFLWSARLESVSVFAR